MGKVIMANKSVVLVTIDCLRADHLSCYGYKRKTTPFMDFLSAKGMKFENASANGPFTAAAFISILASAYPLEFKNQLPLPLDVVLISQVLKKNRIRTAAIHSNPYLSAFYGYNRGWHYFQDFLSSTPSKTLKKRRGFRRSIRNSLPKPIADSYYLSKVFLGFTKSYENAETITKSAISWLSKNKSFPFFLWLHFMDLHEPYLTFDANFERKYSKDISRLSQVMFLKEKQSMIKPKTLRGMMNIYDDKLSYIDENVRKVFHFLDGEGLMDHTLLVLTSDHGEELSDHGCIGHTARFYNELLHIPLILFGPEIRNRVETSPVSQLDIAPTILSYYRIAVPKDYRGHNLLSAHANPFAISEAAHNEKGVYIRGHRIFPSNLTTYAIRTEKWKYIHSKKQRELYNLEEDPRETRNVIDEEETKAEELEAIINEHMQWEKLQKPRAIVHEKKRIRKVIRKLKFFGKV